MSESSAYVIAGAGLAGAKAAETLREEGFGGPVVLIGDEAERPYERPPLSKDYLLGKAERETIYVHPESWYADNGVQVSEITSVGGRVTGVRLADGSQVQADAVIVGVGITPNTQLAAAAGLETGNGVVVDAALRSSDPAVFAAGDVARALHPLLGQDVCYDKVPYFYTDQYDLGMEYAGYVEAGRYDQVVCRGDVDGREFIAFW